MKQNSNTTQFEAMTFCHMEQLYRLAYSRVGNSHDAEDIVQDTYLKAFRAFATVKQSDRVKGWLTQILINSVRDYRRREMRAVVTVDISDVPEDSFVGHNQLSPEDVLCRDEIDPLLMKALRSIPEQYLTTLLLREIQESTYEEIAETLEVPIGTVMSRLSRARSLLRSILMPDRPAGDEAAAAETGGGNGRKRGYSRRSPRFVRFDAGRSGKTQFYRGCPGAHGRMSIVQEAVGQDSRHERARR
jgi:RNA polymerase sigma-70 factor (ECF subfamily)